VPTLTTSDGLELFYRDEGDGPAVVMLHGLTADGEMNWEWTGVAPAVRTAGYRTLLLDQRGHGRSDQPTDPALYDDDRFAADVSSLLDVAGVERCALVGYSMGALMTLRTVPREDRVVCAVLGGIGDRDLVALDREAIARGLEIDDPDEIDDPEARQFRDFADATGANRSALAALQRGRRREPFDLEQITVPTLVIAGADDRLAGDPHGLAHRLPRGEGRTAAGDHTTALLEPSFGGDIVRFLAHHLR
jgi:pimeloyl-ACP methyl ester carboxylesterase